MRSYNLQLIRGALREMRQATQGQLAERTGMSVVTVNALLKVLLKNGEAKLITSALTSENGGRPARQYRYRAEFQLALVLCLGKNGCQARLAVSVENMVGETICHEEESPGEILPEVLLECVRRYREQFPRLALVVLGIPGVEVDGVLTAMDYSVLRGLWFKDWLREQSGLPVFLVNDINGAVFGYGAVSGCLFLPETVVGVCWSEGCPPGAGILLKGELYQGRDGLAGEIAQAFSAVPWPKTDSPLDKAAQTVLNLVRYWNPHRIVLYHEHLSAPDAAAIRGICTAILPERFLPELVTGRNLREDYEQGLRALAHRYLEESIP